MERFILIPLPFHIHTTVTADISKLLLKNIFFSLDFNLSNSRLYTLDYMHLLLPTFFFLFNYDIVQWYLKVYTKRTKEMKISLHSTFIG